MSKQAKLKFSFTISRLDDEELVPEDIGKAFNSAMEAVLSLTKDLRFEDGFGDLEEIHEHKR